MATIVINTVRPNAAAEMLRKMLGALRDAVDAFAVYRMQHAVPEHEFLRADREIIRYRRLIQPGSNSSGEAKAC